MLHCVGRWRPGQDPASLASLLPGRLTLRLRTCQKMLHFPSLQNTQGLIFVVDSNDRERISEAQEELQKMVRLQKNWNPGKIFVDDIKDLKL